MKNNIEFITALNEYNVSRKVNVNESIDERRTRLIWLGEKTWTDEGKTMLSNLPVMKVSPSKVLKPKKITIHKRNKNV